MGGIEKFDIASKRLGTSPPKSPNLVPSHGYEKAFSELDHPIQKGVGEIRCDILGGLWMGSRGRDWRIGFGTGELVMLGKPPSRLTTKTWKVSPSHGCEDAWSGLDRPIWRGVGEVWGGT